MLYEFSGLWFVLGPTLFLAALALWRYPRLWWVSTVVLATGAVIVLYLPIRMARHRPSGSDPVGDGFGIALEFFAILGTFGFVHLFGSCVLFAFFIAAEIEKRKAAKSQQTQ